MRIILYLSLFPSVMMVMYVDQLLDSHVLIYYTNRELDCCLPAEMKSNKNPRARWPEG